MSAPASAPGGAGWTDHGTTLASWFAQGVWPRCRCGYAPRNNIKLSQHYAEFGFTEVDQHGQLVQIPLSGPLAS